MQITKFFWSVALGGAAACGGTAERERRPELRGEGEAEAEGGGAGGAYDPEAACETLERREPLEVDGCGPFSYPEGSRDVQDCCGLFNEGGDGGCSAGQLEMPNDEDLLVDCFELVAQGDMHHMRLDLYFEQEGGVIPIPLIATSTGVAHECTCFPNHGALRIGRKQAADLHYHFVEVDPEQDPAEQVLDLEILLHPVSADRTGEVTPGGFMMMQTADVLVPPGEHEKRTEAELPREMHLWTLMPHQHSRGVGMEVFVKGATRGGEPVPEDVPVYASESWEGWSLGVFEPPIVIPEGGRVEFVCRWDNRTGHDLGWCLTDEGEMCGIAGHHGAPGQAPYFYGAQEPASPGVGCGEGCSLECPEPPPFRDINGDGCHDYGPWDL